VILFHVGRLFDTKTITGPFQKVQKMPKVQWQHLLWRALDQTPACPVTATGLPIARPGIVGHCAPCACLNTFETALVCACPATTTPI
jgi:hypothetical protein